MPEETNPATDHAAVTKSDATKYDPPFRALYIGTTGDVAIKANPYGVAVTYKAVPAGTILPVNAHQVMATGTTAADIVGLWNT